MSTEPGIAARWRGGVEVREGMRRNAGVPTGSFANLAPAPPRPLLAIAARHRLTCPPPAPSCIRPPHATCDSAKFDRTWCESSGSTLRRQQHHGAGIAIGHASRQCKDPCMRCCHRHCRRHRRRRRRRRRPTPRHLWPFDTTTRPPNALLGRHDEASQAPGRIHQNPTHRPARRGR